jgi:hypothetical protein
LQKPKPRYKYEPRTPGKETVRQLLEIPNAPTADVPETRKKFPGERADQSPQNPDVAPYQDFPDGGGGGGNGNGGNNGYGGNGGGGGDGDNGKGDKGDKDPDVIIYCHYCGCPWWHCIWCHYWCPMLWWYFGYDHDYWYGYWNHAWNKHLFHFHEHYDFDHYYPSIYTPPAFIIDPTSEAIEYLDKGAELFMEGKYLEALHMFRLATLVDLNFAVPKFAYAHALFALGLYDYAAYEIKLGLYLMRDWPEIGGDLKLMYGDPADFDEQLAALMAHLKVWPNDEDALLVLGYVSYFTGDLYLAEKVFERLILSSSNNTAYAAGLFMDGIQRIKEFMLQDGADADLFIDDGVSIEEILQK